MEDRHSRYTAPSIESRDYFVAPEIYLFKNGDEHSPSKRFVWNKRQCPSTPVLKDTVTRFLGLNSYCKKIYDFKGREISHLVDLEPGGRYVCANGGFKNVRGGYENITKARPHHLKPLPKYPPPHNHKYDYVASRIGNQPTKGRNIFIYKNGDPNWGRICINFTGKDLQHLQCCIDIVHDKMEKYYYKVNYLVPKGCDFPNPIKYTSEIESGGEYVALDELYNYKPINYHVSAPKPMLVSPRPDYISLAEPSTKDENSLRRQKGLRPVFDYTRTNRPRTLPAIKKNNAQKYTSPDNSVASNPEYGNNRHAKRYNGMGFHAKPTRHKPSPERQRKTHQQVDYDKDNGGVFKAKTTNKETAGAREVKETKTTHTDLPVDQRRAEEVSEEISVYEENMAKVPSGMELNRLPSDPSEIQDEEIHDHENERKTQRKDKNIKDDNRNKKTDRNVKNDSQSKKGTTKGTKSPDNKNINSYGNRASPFQSRSDVQPSPSPVQTNTNNSNVRASTPQDYNQSTYQDTKTPDGRDSAAERERREKAAITIQSHFKGSRTRKDLALKKEQENQKQAYERRLEEEKEKTRQQEEEQRRAEEIERQEREQREAEELARQQSPVSQQMSKDEAATKIQAAFKGNQVRKNLANEKQVNDLKTNYDSTGNHDIEDGGSGNYSNMDEDKAATKIQSQYRGFKARKEINQKKEEERAATKIQAQYRGHKTRQEVAQKKDEEERAATKIQAQYRGHKTRKEVAQKIDEEEKAATKIQAQFRGHKTRKELKDKQKNEKQADDKEFTEEENLAATKIQAGFRGHKTRKELNEKKENDTENKENYNTPAISDFPGDNESSVEGNNNPPGSTAYLSRDPTAASAGTSKFAT